MYVNDKDRLKKKKILDLAPEELIKKLKQDLSGFSPELKNMLKNDLEQQEKALYKSFRASHSNKLNSKKIATNIGIMANLQDLIALEELPSIDPEKKEERYNEIIKDLDKFKSRLKS